jgi:ADP-heptose:LPS heptosyltransferase
MQPVKSMTILLSRTDSIGDVVLSLPMAGVIKGNFPEARVLFLGRTYTKSVVEACEHVDEFINYDELIKQSEKEQVQFIQAKNIDAVVHVFPQKHIATLMKKAKVLLRVGTRNRFFHWFTCNKRLALSRKNSDLHESQLNIQLLSFLNIKTDLPLHAIAQCYGFTQVKPLSNELFLNVLDKNKIKVVLHPRSKGSAREWGLDNFSKLILALPENRYQIFISGTKEDGKSMEDFIAANSKAIDITGKLTLEEFISFIESCDVLVAASTGPLHIAAALGKQAIGLFAPMRPIHPGRWAPVGENAHHLVITKNCSDCRKGGKCLCIEQIQVNQVINLIEKT